MSRCRFYSMYRRGLAAWIAAAVLAHVLPPAKAPARVRANVHGLRIGTREHGSPPCIEGKEAELKNHAARITLHSHLAVHGC